MKMVRQSLRIRILLILLIFSLSLKPIITIDFAGNSGTIENKILKINQFNADYYSTCLAEKTIQNPVLLPLRTIAYQVHSPIYAVLQQQYIIHIEKSFKNLFCSYSILDLSCILLI